MCLDISTRHHPDRKPLIAEEDIEVVKYLALPDDYFYLDCDHMMKTMHCPLRTPFMLMPIVFDGNEECVLESSAFEAKPYENSDELWLVEEGIHAYTMDFFHLAQGNCLSDLAPFHAYIPEGTKYYIGISGDIVAEKMIIKNEIYENICV